MASPDPHVLLYFDVNKTVIMHDPVQGKDLGCILNDLLTERALGNVDTSADGELQWRWNGRPGLQQPSEPAAEHEVSYGTFLRAKYPTSREPATAKLHKKMRKVLRQDFTSPGNAGHGLAAEHALLLENLKLPDLPEDGAAEYEVLRKSAALDESEYFFMVPAFFQLIRTLHDRGVSFNLIFRTFGDDLHRIAQEFNCFCEGKHPYFPGVVMDGSMGTVDRRIHLAIGLSNEPDSATTARFGTFYRADGYTALVLGTFGQPGKDEELRQDASFYTEHHPHARVLEGIPTIHRFLTHEWRDRQSTLAFRDFYPHWFRNCEDAAAGKLLTMDDQENDVHAVFFDDNILAHDAHIVDARNVRDGSAVPFELTRDVHLMRVEALDVIRDENYFVNRYEQALARRRENTST